MQNAMDITFATKVEQEEKRRMVTKGHPKTFIQKLLSKNIEQVKLWLYLGGIVYTMLENLDCNHNTENSGSNPNSATKEAMWLKPHPLLSEPCSFNCKTRHVYYMVSKVSCHL